MYFLADAGLALAFFCGWAGLARLLRRDAADARAQIERSERKLDLLLHHVGLDYERDEIDAGFPPRPNGECGYRPQVRCSRESDTG